jgi:hypothetical protein
MRISVRVFACKTHSFRLCETHQLLQIRICTFFVEHILSVFVDYNFSNRDRNGLKTFRKFVSKVHSRVYLTTCLLSTCLLCLLCVYFVYFIYNTMVMAGFVCVNCARLPWRCVIVMTESLRFGRMFKHQTLRLWVLLGSGCVSMDSFRFHCICVWKCSQYSCSA